MSERKKNCFLFHSWAGCTCSKCGKRRDTGHQFRYVPAGSLECRQECAVCGKTGTRVKHDYQQEGCIPVCKRCGYRNERNAGHQFEKVEGQCIRRCKVCGAEEPLRHEMRGRIRDGRCERFCKNCGYTEEGHQWNRVVDYRVGMGGWDYRDGCRCELCRTKNPDGLHSWKKIREGNFADIQVCTVCGTRDESKKITLEEARRREQAYEEAMERADSLHDMRAQGIKC